MAGTHAAHACGERQRTPTCTTAAQAVGGGQHQFDLVAGLVGHARVDGADFHRGARAAAVGGAAEDVQLRLQLLLDLHLDGGGALDGGGSLGGGAARGA
ncbi:hypothetical protein [Ralstonia syzygii]|uniref:hypothetical protein n=1 Tax=Ralstonia syzygii TaxID=28097 RepID=UPI0036F2C03F